MFSPHCISGGELKALGFTDDAPLQTDGKKSLPHGIEVVQWYCCFTNKKRGRVGTSWETNKALHLSPNILPNWQTGSIRRLQTSPKALQFTPITQFHQKHYFHSSLRLKPWIPDRDDVVECSKSKCVYIILWWFTLFPWYLPDDFSSLPPVLPRRATKVDPSLSFGEIIDVWRVSFTPVFIYLTYNLCAVGCIYSAWGQLPLTAARHQIHNERGSGQLQCQTTLLQQPFFGMSPQCL